MSPRNKQCRSKSLWAITAVYFAVMLASPLTAATGTATLSLTASVIDTCTVSATSAVFGNLTNSVDNDASGAVVITCTSDKSGTTVAVNGGSWFASDQRRMKSATGDFHISYDVYSTSSSTTKVIENGNVGTPFNNTALDPKTINIYLRAPSAVYNAGAYADSLTITVTYGS